MRVERPLSVEDFLKQRRKRRLLTLTPLVALGNEHIPLLLFSGAYLSLGWYVRLHVPNHAGEAHKLFDWILYGASVLLVVTVWMVYRSARGYLDVAPATSSTSAKPDSGRKGRRQARRGRRPKAN